WIPRKENDENTNICHKLDRYVNSPYSNKEYLNYSDIIETVKENLKGFYALLDQAKEEPNPGFTVRPIDLISELDFVLKNNYSHEFQFIYDVTDLIQELRDGHTSLSQVQLSSGTFHQINDFNDIKDPSNIDCQVIDIDDKPAIEVITEFARNHTSFARDLNARFNSALASLAFGKGDFYIAGQLFTIRNQLPKIQVLLTHLIAMDLGVVLISTESNLNSDPDLEYRFLTNVAIGFKLLADKGIKKANNDLSIPTIEEISKLKIDSEFDYRSFISAKTNSSFDSVNDFIGNNVYTRGGVHVKYTSKAFINDTTLYSGTLKLLTPPKLPWTEKDIIILTNGLCQSACALITQRLAKINVPTIAVGGFSNTRFSFAQSAVGDAYSSDDILFLLEQLRDLDSSLISKLSIPANLTLSFILAEAYSLKNPNEVMDYAFRPADYQLYYDERSARDPSQLWIQAAKYFGK
ncbi:16569_t:CDS:2, partial [Dentiscutata erythropus]